MSHVDAVTDPMCTPREPHTDDVLSDVHEQRVPSEHGVGVAIVAATRLRSTIVTARISPIEMAPVMRTNEGVQSRLFTSIVDSHSNPSTSATPPARRLAQPASTEQITGQPSDED